ncbi:MAG: glutamate--cysteine ligase, partial [Dehalococcoidaceae bacterium]|nr:glutamate--cysteine ligase [Dehalococcoidaceae bacterium]
MTKLLNKTKFIEYFEKGIKKNSEQKIGTEHEKFILDKNSFLPLEYDKLNGIKDIFIELIKLGWAPISEGENNTIIGLSLNNQFISLEPAGQFELSGDSLDNIHQTCDEITNHLHQMKKLSYEYEFILLGIGVEPRLNLNDFNWMPKDRYSIMKDYMPTVGKHGLDMMQRTCSTQVNLDYCSEQDMIKKFRVLLSLESIGTAIFANSPFSEGQL